MRHNILITPKNRDKFKRLSFESLKKGDSIYASFWWISEKKPGQDGEYVVLVFDKIVFPNKYQFLYKGTQRPHRIDLDELDEKTIDGGLDIDYLVTKDDNYGLIHAYSFNLDTLLELTQKYFK